MRKSAYSIVGCIIGTIVSVQLLPGVQAADWQAQVLFGAVLGAVYLVLRPLLKLIAFPLAILTLGLIYVLVDAALLWSAAQPFAGFTIDSYGWAIAAAVVVNLCRGLCRALAKK